MPRPFFWLEGTFPLGWAGYLSNVTNYFLLTSTPAEGGVAPVDAPITLVFSLPLWRGDENLARVTLERDGAAVAAAATLDGRILTLTPAAPLAAGASYTVRLDPALESWGERPLVGAGQLRFRAAAAAGPKLQGDYVWTVDMPVPDFAVVLWP